MTLHFLHNSDTAFCDILHANWDARKNTVCWHLTLLLPLVKFS